MSGRRYRVVGDCTFGFSDYVPEGSGTEAEEDRKRMSEIMDRERAAAAASRSARVIPMRASSAQITPPTIVFEPWMAPGTTLGHETIEPISVYRRWPAHEAILQNDGTKVAAVWALVHATENQQLFGVAAKDEIGRAHIFLVTNRLPCPLLRLGVARHEARHIDRDDLQRTGYSPFREAEYLESERDCMDAGALRVRAFADIVNASGRAPSPVDAAACEKCYRGECKPCPQGRDVYESVNQVLGLF